MPHIHHLPHGSQKRLNWTRVALGRTETTRLGLLDTVLLAVFAVVAAGLVIWVDMA
jgi:hypothetical protein